MKKYFLPILIAVSALSISVAAAYYSVTGLSLLFAGVATAVIWMGSSLEAAKLVIASLLYQYWEKLNKALKIYLTTALLTLIIITSAGIYGFLSAGFQDTLNKSNVVDNEIALIESKIDQTLDSKEFAVYQLKESSKNITSLREAMGNNVITYTDADGNQVRTTSHSTRRAYERQLKAALSEKESLTLDVNRIDSTLNALETEKIELSSSAEVAAELGPLKYLSNLTGKPMEDIINWFLLTIIFVFDPLAISLVIASNFAFSQIKPKEEDVIEGKKEYEIYKPEDKVEEKKTERVEPTPEPEKVVKNQSKQIDLTGQIDLVEAKKANLDISMVNKINQMRRAIQNVPITDPRSTPVRMAINKLVSQLQQQLDNPNKQDEDRDIKTY